MFTLSLGYLTVPVELEQSVYNTISPFDRPSWEHESTLSIAYFVEEPPDTYPTKSIHTIKLASSSAGDIELFQLIASSLQQDEDRVRPLYGIIHFNCTDTQTPCMGIVSSLSPELDTLFLRVIDASLLLDQKHDNQSNYPALDFELWSTYPMEILNCCDRYQKRVPGAADQLTKLVNETHKIAKLYGYWSLWQITEGILTRFQLDASPFLSSN
ncbi:hypothetical protein DM01DRAFT_1128606 [Hesseltinella vesiculosa]|uniref:Uncharacterized protein n=1 Tax=Hesseltinella vesiculosa TaxID=101127 RepID=A0A1X2GUN4_9FUNG|nr:hypothetical protein DM01DRAFT_1128606 [Hesseltinella vesiculosa]